MKLVELTRPDFPFKDIHTAYIRPAVTPPALIQPAKKPTQEELKNEQAARRFFVVLRGIGLLFALLLLFAFSFSVGGFIITGLFAAFVIAPKPVSVTLTAYLTWLLTHFAGVGVFALTAIPAAVVAVLRQDVWLSLIAVCLVLCLVTAAVTSLAVRLIGNRHPAALDEEAEDLTPAQDIAQRLPEVLVDYYAPLSEFRRPTPLRSQFVDEQAWQAAVDDQNDLVRQERLVAVSRYIVSVEDDEAKQGVVSLVLAVRSGGTDDELVKLAPVLRSQLNVYSVDEFDYDARGGFVGFRVNTSGKPTSALVTPRGFPYPLDTASSSYNYIPFGPDAELNEVGFGFEESNIIFGGVPGGGKSVGHRAYLWGVAQLPNTAICGIDLKRVELAPWDARLSARARTREGAAELLRLLVGEMERRYEWMEAQGYAKITPEVAAATGIPMISVPIDEYAMLSAFTHAQSPKEDKDLQSEMTLCTRRLVSEGRAAGINMNIATQKPSSKILDTDFRDMFQQAVAFKTRTPTMTNMILGEGMAQLGADSHLINTDIPSKGICYLVSEGSDVPVEARPYFLPGGNDLKALVQTVAHLRQELPFLGDFNERFGVSSGAARPSVDEASEAQLSSEDADAEAVRLALENLS